MASSGPVPIQGCALRVSRLNADGSIPAASLTGMIVDDKPIVSLMMKPNVLAGVEIVPVSACGVPLIAYKDYDRFKRYDVTLTLGDADFDKWEMLGGGSLLQAGTSTGRTFADGATTNNSTTITSPALAAFVSTDVGRTVTGTGITAGSIIVQVISGTSAVISTAATATATGLSLVLGALAARTVGYQIPQLLSVPNANGVALEMWQKAITRSTGYVGTTPYPSVGTSGTPPTIQSSAYIRVGVFRFIPTPQDINIEDKEGQRVFSGWAIENPNFGTGPIHDWTTTGLAGGPPLDTTRAIEAMMDFQLPTPLQPGYQSTT